MSAPPPNDKDSETQRPEATAAMNGQRCHNCGGRLGLLVRVEPQTSGQPVTYYACEHCAQVLVRKS